MSISYNCHAISACRRIDKIPGTWWLSLSWAVTTGPTVTFCTAWATLTITPHGGSFDERSTRVLRCRPSLCTPEIVFDPDIFCWDDGTVTHRHNSGWTKRTRSIRGASSTVTELKKPIHHRSKGKCTLNPFFSIKISDHDPFSINESSPSLNINASQVRKVNGQHFLRVSRACFHKRNRAQM